jgi:RNA polymerase sigma-70 factor (ECF subfamily)
MAKEPTVTAYSSPSETGDPAAGRLTPVWDAGLAYDAYRGRLFASVLRSTRDDEMAADIVQEAFLELVRAGQRGDLPENELAWLHRVAANRVIDWARKRARWAGHVPPSEDTEDAPEVAVLRREAGRELHAALETLPGTTRQALLLEGEGYQPAEIARVIGRTGQATRTLLCRARRQLRDSLGAQPA